MNVYPQSDGMEDTYEELESVFDKFLKCHRKILLDFLAKVSREDIFKPTIGNESLHGISNDNGVDSCKLCYIQKSDCRKYNVPTSYSKCHVTSNKAPHS
jgi:hypothetical protein